MRTGRHRRSGRGFAAAIAAGLALAGVAGVAVPARADRASPSGGHRSANAGHAAASGGHRSANAGHSAASGGHRSAAAATSGAAQGVTATASGAVGAGMFGTHPSTSVDLGVDVAGPGYAVGFGGRLTYLAGSGFRRRAWDSASEFAGILRYALYRRRLGDRVDLSAAAGELGDVELGHGELVGGYSAGLDLDRGHLGTQIRARGDRLGASLMIDDLVSPRIVAARGTYRVADHLRAGAQAAADLSAPSMTGPALVTLAAADLAYDRAGDGGRLRGGAYAALGAAFGLGAGLHIGVTGHYGAPGAVRVGTRAELRAAAGGYIPGWFGPTYERDRRGVVTAAGMQAPTQLDRARAGGLGGLGSLGEVTLDLPGIGTARMAYAARPGLPDQAVLRLAAPYVRGFQAGLWGAVDLDRGAATGLTMAAELRARLPEHLFVSLEAARLYHDAAAGLAPIWTAQAAVGAVVGE